MIARDPVPSSCDVAVVGAGILGLASGRELQRRHPSLSVCVLEREDRIAAHQTGHNSGVLHSGIYYVPGSLKARLCREGIAAMYAFCEERGIAHERCGKVIVATGEDELERLDELERRAHANGVPGMRRLDPDGIRELEPHATGIAGLHSPAAGIADFAAVAEALASDLGEADGAVMLACGVEGVEAGARAIRLRHARGELEAGHALFCAGAWSDRLAVAAGAEADPRIVPFRGAYLRLKPDRASLVRSLIYPVPDPALPFLGVHLTRHASGEVLVGPTALMAGARDAYRLGRVRPGDLAATLTWPGTWRLAGRRWRAGAVEVKHAASRRAFVAAARRLVPDLTPGDVEPAFAGVRAQALGRDGTLVDDFAFSATERALHVRNAPSPGATSAFAIARHVADEAEVAFGLSKA
jgi:(S)-2-hydroxyglutarate dehydrogenase